MFRPASPLGRRDLRHILDHHWIRLFVAAVLQGTNRTWVGHIDLHRDINPSRRPVQVFKKIVILAA